MTDAEVEAVARRCDKCRFWEAPTEGEWLALGIGTCRKTPQLWDATGWARDASGDDDYINRAVLPEYAGQMSFVEDGSDYHAALLTKAEFYCAHFAALDQARAKER